jgi:hypothetical protein
VRRWLLAALLAAAVATSAQAQYGGNIPPGSVLGNPEATARPAVPMLPSQARGGLGVGRPVSIMDFGARADAVTYPDAVVAAGSTTLTSARANFTQGDIGKKIQVDGAAGIWQPPLRTTIAAVVDAHTVTLAAAATKATPSRWLAAAFVATPRTAGNYVPGDLLTVQGGTYTTQAVLKVVSTNVTATSIAAAGANGVNGACRVQGTTGTGTMLQQDVTIAGGAITALGSIVQPGHYFTKPTNIAAEPVTNAPGYNCVPTGATLNLTMGVEQVAVTTKGDYDPVAIPADPFATSAGSIGGATGATFTSGGIPWGTFTATGTYVYGTDDSAALKTAIDTAAASFTAGRPSYVFMPTGNYLIDSTSTPLMQSGLGVKGEGTDKTNIIIGANYVGDLFSWSEAWGGTAMIGNGLGNPTYLISGDTSGPKAVGFSVMGTRAAGAQQNVLMFYDRNDNVFIDDIEITAVNGRCLGSGTLRVTVEAYMRESLIGRLRCHAAGAPGIPAMEFGTVSGGESSNEINLNDINIYANYGDGLVFKDNIGGIRISKLRIEGQQWADLGADLLRIGDPASMYGSIVGITVDQLELFTAYPGKAALRVTAPPADASRIYFIRVLSGAIGSGLPMGYGVVLEAGRNMTFKLHDIYSWNTNWTMTSAAAGTFLDMDGQEQNLTYNVANPRALSMPVRKIGLPFAQIDRGLTPTLSPIFPDNTVRGGLERGSGAVDWQMVRNTPGQVAGGVSSALGGGDANSIGSGALQSVVAGGSANTNNAPLSVIGGGFGNTATGNSTAIPGGTFTNDRGATGGLFLGGPNGCAPFQISGACQRSWHVLSAFPNTAAAARLTSDGAAPNGANCIKIPAGTAYQTVVRATARNWTTHETASWDAIQGMLSLKPSAATTYLGGAGGAPTLVTAGALGTLAVSADTANACLNLTYTPPVGNVDYIHIVATVDLTEVQ